MTPSTTTEEELWRAYLAGDIRAGERLFAGLRRPLSAICWAICRDRSRVDEALQETYVRIVKGRTTFRAGHPFRPWVFQIARNAAWDELRRARHNTVAEEHREAGEAPTPLEALLSLDHAEVVAQGIRELPERLREAVILRYGLDLDSETISELLGISPAALWARLSRARAALRRRIHD